MPKLRKLTDDEIAKLEGREIKARQRVATQYDEILAAFGTGDYGLLELDPADRRTTVRNRLEAAAARRCLRIVYQRPLGAALRFWLEVIES